MSPTKKNNKKTTAKHRKSDERINLEFSITGIRPKVTCDSGFYSKNDLKEIQRVLTHMCREICIDKTYVDFKGSRWKTPFIDEEKWYEFTRLVIDSDFGNKSKKANEEILCCLMAISIGYMIHVCGIYGYDTEELTVAIAPNSNMSASYREDFRKNWTF